MSVEFTNDKNARINYYKDQNRRRTESGLPEQKEGTVGIELKTITFSERTRSVTIYNSTVDATSILSFSFDGGTNFLNLTSGTNWKENVEVDNMVISGNKANTKYQIIAIK